MVQARVGSEGTVGMMVRMPESLRDRIKAAAEASGRSQNSEIVAALEEKYPAPERIFRYDLWKAHVEMVQKRTDEIFDEIQQRVDQLEAASRRGEKLPPQEEVDAIFHALRAELSELHDFDIEDDQFHEVHLPPTDD